MGEYGPDVTSAFETLRKAMKSDERTRLQMSLRFNATARGPLIDSRRRPIGSQIIGLEEKSDYRLNERETTNNKQ